MARKERMKLASARYIFLFDPGKTWQRLYQFETELVNMLSARGMEGVIVETVGGGNEKIIYVRPKDREGRVGPVAATGQSKQRNLTLPQKKGSIPQVKSKDARQPFRDKRKKPLRFSKGRERKGKFKPIGK